MVSCKHSADNQVECKESDCRACLTKSFAKLDTAKRNLETALAKATKDEQIADDLRDYWRNLNSGAER